MNKTNKGVEKIEKVDLVLANASNTEDHPTKLPKSFVYACNPNEEMIVDKLNEIIDFLNTNQTKANKK